MPADEGAPSSGPLSLTQAEDLEPACDQFEARWKAGERPAIEEFLAGSEGARRAVLARELVAIEAHWRRRAGEQPTAAEYRARFPHDEAIGALAFGPDEGEPPNPRANLQPYPNLPDYEILGELGRGGMGVVYKARQLRLQRTVALKMILQGLHAGKEASARFLAEAATIARVRHANIIQIYHVDEYDGQVYFEMEHVDGGSLASQLRGVPWPPREAARLVEAVGHAMAEAHRLGVVHRDLKPSNILLTSDGVPRVADFGLAKLLDSDSGLTQSNSILGSPSYMAPEQAGGRARSIGPAADIYALGAILYELLTGRPPFRGETVLDTLQQVKMVEPVPPSRLVPALPRDMETIVLRCLQKDPARRYADASALAEDLRRFQHREPIRARRIGPLGRTAGWCRRQPVVAALVGLVATLVAAMAVGSVVFVLRLSQAALQSEQARQQAENTLAQMLMRNGIEAGSQGDPASAVLWFASAARQAQQDPQRRHENQIRARAWSRGAAQPVQAFPHPALSVPELALGSLGFSPDGRFLLTPGVRGRPLVWDLAREQEPGWMNQPGQARFALWGSRGEWIALAFDTDEVLLRGLPDGRELQRIATRGSATTLALSPDGSLLAIASDVIQLWDCRANVLRTSAWECPAPVSSLHFSPDGSRLLAACKNGQALVFDTSAASPRPSPLFPPTPHQPPREPVPPRFVDQGRGFLTLTGPETLTWWDTRTGAQIRSLHCPVTAIDVLEISHNGRYLAVGGYAGGQVWDLSSPAEPKFPLADGNSIQAIDFSPDDQVLATGGAGRAARLWSLDDGSPVGAPIAHQGFVARVAFSPSGRFLATEQLDGLVRVWQIPPDDSPGEWLTNDMGVDAGRPGPDGRRVIAAAERTTDGVTGKTRVYDAVAAQPAGPYLAFPGVLRDARLSPDGQSAATVSWLAEPQRAELRFWQIATGKPIGPAIPLPSEPIHLAYSPDGRLAAVSCRAAEIPVIDTRSGQLVAMARHQPIRPFDHPSFSDLSFSPDGKHLVSLGSDGSIQDFFPTTGVPQYSTIQLGAAGWFVDFAPDGSRMAVGTADGRVRVWTLAHGLFECELPRHPDWVYMAVFSPDGRQLLTACRDGEARLWDLATLRLVCPPFRHGVEVMAVAFSPDGRHVATSSRDETIRVWEWRTGALVMPPFGLASLGTFTLAFTADGRHLIAAGRQPATGLFSYDTSPLRAPETLGLDDLRTFGELVSSSRLENGDLAGLTTAEWLERWNQFHPHHPGPAVVDPPPGEPEGLPVP